MDLILDFETYCEQPIKKTGAVKYACDDTMKPLCLAYCEFDPKTLTRSPVQLWNFKEVEPDLSGYDFYWAFNAQFDWLINWYSDKVFNIPFSISYWKNVQVVASKFSLPQNLKDLAIILESKVKKNPDGNLYINRCCKKNSKTPSWPDYQKLFEYCKDDVRATFEVLKDMPSLKISDMEWDLWRETVRMNIDGLPIDFPAARAIKKRVDAYKTVLQEEVPRITNGEIQKPTQTVKIKQYLNKRGVDIPNLQADTLKNLNLETIPDDCKQLVMVRQAAGASSVAKFDKLLEMQVRSKVHDFLRYGAQNTQRWSGSGFQVQSLPKKTVDDPEELIERFKNMGEIENPIQAAKALCRSMIKAPSDQLIYQGDYSSIEYLLLIWITDMKDMLQMFKDEKSAYIDMASYLFNKPYESIDKEATDNLEYFLGKQVILGCGYQMGPKKFKDTCQRYGVDITLDLANFAVKTYRRKYRPIANLWRSVHERCIVAIQNKNKVYKAFKCKFRCSKDKRGVLWLIITLPSGSSLYYNSPELTLGKYGYEIKHMGQYNYKWTHRFLSPGRITENIIQKLARDLMAYSIYQMISSRTFTALMTVHDELVSLGSDKRPDELLKRYISILQRTPEWAVDLPLRATGYYNNRYKKG